MLLDTELGFFARVPADRGRVDEDLGALHGRQAGGFGEPLIPANQNADAAKARVESAKAEIAGSEIVFFVEERILRDVHLAIKTEDGAVRIEDHRGIVIDAGGAAFE